MKFERNSGKFAKNTRKSEEIVIFRGIWRRFKKKPKEILFSSDEL